MFLSSLLVFSFLEQQSLGEFYLIYYVQRFCFFQLWSLHHLIFFGGGGGCIMWTYGLPVNRLQTPRPLYYIKDPDHAETGLTYTQCFAVVQVFPGNCKAVLSFLCVLYKAGASLTDCILWNARRILQRHQENCIHIYYSGNMYITLLRIKKGKLFTVWSK